MGLWISIIALLILIPLAFSSVSLAPWVPSRAVDLSRILTLAGIRPGEHVVELGAGNGRVTLYLARMTTGGTFTAVERAWPLALIIWLRAGVSGIRAVRVRWTDLFKEPLQTANVVYVFGMPDPLRLRLKAKLEQELKPGSRVISYAFPIEGLVPAITDTAPRRATIYLYQF